MHVLHHSILMLVLALSGLELAKTESFFCDESVINNKLETCPLPFNPLENAALPETEWKLDIDALKNTSKLVFHGEWTNNDIVSEVISRSAQYIKCPFIK